jgi:NADP-dependent 3-hydroxy acid dehydrogenase YdfG
MELRGKVAIITGASSGIGEAAARNLREAGMKLVITGRRGEPLLALTEELGETIPIAGDISEPALPALLLERALAEFGRCDVVFNNAGVIEAATIDAADIERICTMVRVNVEAAFRMAYTALKHFLAVKAGHLVTTSSVLGTKVRVTAGAYAGTKYAVEALSEALRLELANTPIKVTCLEPGLVMTGLHRHLPVHPREAFNIQQPLVPEDIARVLRFVLEQPDHVLIPRVMVLPNDQDL